MIPFNSHEFRENELGERHTVLGRVEMNVISYSPHLWTDISEI